MGKTSRKMNKNKQQQNQSDTSRKIRELKQQAKEQESRTEHAEALETLAELLKLDCRDVEVIYAIAWNYFQVGDYERAAKWSQNTLQINGGHIEARILLGRLCLLEDRIDDALAIYEFIFTHYGKSLTDEQVAELKKLLKYYGEYEAELVKSDYPHVRDFMEKHLLLKDATAVDSGVRDTQTVPPAEETMAASSGEEKHQDKSAATGAMSALERLRALKQKIQSAGNSGKDKQEAESRQAGGKETAVKQQNTDAPEDEALSRKQEVLDKQCSVAEKVRLLHAAAGSYYFAGKFASAELLLNAAWELDQYDEQTLRNLAIVQAEQGEQEQALKTAGQMHTTDFALLHLIRSLGK